MSDDKPESTIEKNRHLEADKLLFEFLKHLTTVNSGLIVVITAFVGRFSPSTRDEKMVIGVCVACLALSLVACLMGMFSIWTKIDDSKQDLAKAANWIMNCAAVAFVTFYVGVASLSIVTIFRLVESKPTPTIQTLGTPTK